MFPSGVSGVIVRVLRSRIGLISSFSGLFVRFAGFSPLRWCFGLILGVGFGLVVVSGVVDHFLGIGKMVGLERVKKGVNFALRIYC